MMRAYAQMLVGNWGHSSGSCHLVLALLVPSVRIVHAGSTPGKLGSCKVQLHLLRTLVTPNNFLVASGCSVMADQWIIGLVSIQITRILWKYSRGLKVSVLHLFCPMAIGNKTKQRKCFSWSGEEDSHVPGDSVCLSERGKQGSLWFGSCFSRLFYASPRVGSYCAELITAPWTNDAFFPLISPSTWNVLFPSTLGNEFLFLKKLHKHYCSGTSCIKLFLIHCTPAPSHIHAVSLSSWGSLLGFLDVFQSTEHFIVLLCLQGSLLLLSFAGRKLKSGCIECQAVQWVDNKHFLQAVEVLYASCLI